MDENKSENNDSQKEKSSQVDSGESIEKEVTENEAMDIEMNTADMDSNPAIEDKSDCVNKTEKVLIIDPGTKTLRIGDMVKECHDFLNAVGKLKKMYARTGMNLQNTFFGEEVEKKMKMCDIIYPFENGRIIKLDTFTEVLAYAFQRNQNTNLSEYKIIVKAEKEDISKLLDLFFRKYNPQAFLLANQASLSLIAVGCSTGLVVNIGEGISKVVPIIENRIVENAVDDNLGCSGRILTEELRVMLNIDDTPAGHKRAMEIKEKYCYVASDPETEMERVLSKSVELPDGQQIQIKSEQYQCPEVLFEKVRIHEVIVKAIQNCEENKQDELYKNIVLAGGTTMLKGFPERLEKEIKALVADGTEIKIIAPSDRMNLAWKGGQKIASENLFSSNWITRDDFKENEAELIQSKYI